MTHHPTEETLHRLMDGELPASQAATVEAHVIACARCGELVDGLERLRRATKRVPREIDPPPELWSALRDRLPTETREPASPAEGRAWRPDREVVTPRPHPSPSLWLAAAAVLLLALGGTATVLRRGQGPIEPIPSGRPSAPQVAAASTTPDLVAELGESARLITPEMRATFEENVRQLDAAIAAVARAAAADPDNVHLEAMLTRARRQRADYVQGTITLASGL